VTSRVPSVDCAHTGRLANHARALGLALGITLLFMLAEALGGLLAHSLALLADAGHMLGDAASLALALFVAWVARRPPTASRTYGYLRLEILAALVNGAALLVIAAAIVWQAIRRVVEPADVHSGLMLVVAALGLVANVATLKLLRHGHEHSLNLHAAYLHVLGDLLGSVGALLAGLVIAFTGWTPADPIVSAGIALLILVSAWRLLRDSVDVLLEATPRHISLGEVERALTTTPGVASVHDLHVWTVTSGMVAMTGHAVLDDPTHAAEVLATVEQRMAELGIHHVTVQLETEPGCREPAPI
jgi:cobalt-zinc-cadmium efflux system protein